MRQTFQINLADFAFHIDEDAHTKLHNYLSNIEKAIDDKNSTKEILQDVEARIAEILLPITQQEEMTIVTLKDVEEVIQIIGPPTDFGAGTIDDEPSAKSSNPEFTLPYVRKRLHRDPYNRVLAGVCSGLGAYFNVSPILFRILFIFGVLWGASLIPQIIPPYVFLSYIILWVVMPKAITLEQRRQMFGENENMHKAKHTQFRKSTTATGTSSLWGGIKIAIGITLIVLTFIGLMALTLSILFSSVAVNIFPSLMWVHQLHGFLFFPEQSFAILTGIGLLVGIPLLVLFYLGLCLIFQFQKGAKTFGALALIFWLVGLGLVIYSSVALAQGFQEKVQLEEQIYPQPFNGDTLYLNSNPWPESFKSKKWFNAHQLRSKITDKQLIIERDPVITLIENSDRFALVLTRKAHGKTIEEAETNAQNVEFFWLQKDSILQIDPSFTLRAGAKMRFQELKVTIEIPEGKYLKIAPELQKNIKR
ncbi:MAG TPA: PspC domain-containing protein [Marinilabiliaceae bacterium]|nr:PspC domain-containing protein [Marinilabiliaceae bacterium]